MIGDVFEVGSPYLLQIIGKQLCWRNAKMKVTLSISLEFLMVLKLPRSLKELSSHLWKLCFSKGGLEPKAENLPTPPISLPGSQSNKKSLCTNPIEMNMSCARAFWQRAAVTRGKHQLASTCNITYYCALMQPSLISTAFALDNFPLDCVPRDSELKMYHIYDMPFF